MNWPRPTVVVRRRSTLRWFLGPLALLLLTLSWPALAAHDGWTRSQIVEGAESLLGTAVELIPTDALPGNLFLLDPTEENTCFLGARDQAWFFATGEFGQVLLIGSGDRIHTIWAYFPVVSVRDTDAAFVFFDGLFTHLFPGWTEATGWAKASLSAAWGKGALAYQDPMVSLNEMIARNVVGGARLATSGVPPDLVTYRVTARAECEKVSDYLLAKPRRALCDPNRMVPEDAFRQVLLYHTRPEPIDRSETPFFLGTVSAQAFQSEELEFDLPGGLRDGPLDWSSWFSRQLQGEVALEQILSEDWLCAQHFIYSVSAPEIASESDRSWLLSVESVSAYATRAGDDIRYEPNLVRGLVFATAAPTTSPRPPSLEPPYLLVQEGDLVFETEGDSVPVDVSDVPFQLGEIFIRFGRTTFPEHLPFDGRLDGLSFILTSRSTGAAATVDLGQWLDRQEGVGPAPDRARPISHPVLDFELDGRRFRLVVSALDFETVDDQTPRATGLSGHLFGARS